MTAESLRRRSATLHARAALLDQIGAALAYLEGTAVPDSSMHSARKAIKRARATLRLMRDALPDGTYRRENQALRDAARPLSATRDAKVLVEALDRLVDTDVEIEATAIEGFRRALVGSLDHARRGALSGDSGIVLSSRRLRAVRRRVARWPVGAGGWPMLRKGLRRTYARGRRALAAVRAERSAGCLHEWRKQVKYLWHQLQFLTPIGRRPIGRLADQAHRLSDYLGDDHDLFVLREHVRAHLEALDDQGTQRALIAAIDRARDDLERRALELGSRLYEEKAARFAVRFDRYWRDRENRRSRPQAPEA